MQTAYLASIVLFITSIAHFVIGITIYLKNKKNRVNIAFFVLGLTLFFWTLFYGITYLTRTDSQTLFWTRILTIPTFFYPSLFLYLALIFPENKYKTNATFLIYHSLFVFLFLSSVFSKNYIYSAHLVPQGIDFKFGVIYNILGIYIVSTMLYGCYVLIKKLFTLKGVNKSQILYVCLGAFVSIMIGAIFGVTLPILNIPQYNFFAPAGTIFVIGLWGYAITKHELMDIRVVISRGLAYGISGTVLVASFVGLNALRMPMPLTMATNALLALFWAFAAHRLREFIQTPLEEKWITGWYDPNKLMNQIAQKLVPIMERKEAFKIIAEELKQGIKIKQIDIITDSAELKALADEGLKKDILRLKDKLLIPLASSDSLEGVLALSPKISEDPYDNKDLTLFRTIMAQALAILDRIRPYEEIKKDFEANQKKLYDAEKQLERTQRLASL
ncbi:MAG: histidine kinase N-terminal 7TM domain-containing protein, partial [Candidatus Margulisiibacteriota bacterium]